MLTKEEILNIIEKRARAFGAKKVVVFGSFIDGPNQYNDIDIACDIEGLGLLEFAGKLENELRIPIDIFPIESNSDFIKSISTRGMILYE